MLKTYFIMITQKVVVYVLVKIKFDIIFDFATISHNTFLEAYI